MTENWDIPTIIELLQKSGRIALAHYEDNSWELKQDKSLVTVADQAIEQLLCGALEDTAINHYVIGEETVDTKGDDYIQSALKGTTYIVDPIDGTAAFAHHLPTWGISIGLMENSNLREGAIYMPALGELVITSQGENLKATGVTPDMDSKQIELTPYSVDYLPFTEASMLALGQSLVKHGNIELPNPVQSTCCAVFAFMNLLSGSYSTYIGDMKFWDVAGSLPILANADIHIELAAPTGALKAMGPDITEATINLAADHAKRWYLNGTLVSGTQSTIKVIGELIAAKTIQL